MAKLIWIMQLHGDVVMTFKLISRRRFIAGGSVIILSGCSGIDKSTSTGSVLDSITRSDLLNKPKTKITTSAVQRSGAIEFDFVDGFSKLNDVRNREGLASFKNDPRLQKAAQDYANLMAAKGKYGHEIGPGTQFKKRINAAGYDNSAGENLGVGYVTVDAAIAGWFKSDGHRRNMLKPHYRLAGLAYAYNNSGNNPQYTHLWVLIMGKDDGFLG